jgi:uridine kinase
VTEVETFAELAAEILRRPARLGRVRLVAVDGPTGAGKTMFAGRLSRAVREAGTSVAVVHTDELLDGWEDQFTFWRRLEATVLAPIERGEPGRHPVYDWALGRFALRREVPVPDVLIVEGSTAARPEVYPRLSLSVFLTADPRVRLARVLARDGPAIEAQLRRWSAAEDAFFAAARTAEHADRLVDAVTPVGHDPECGYVRLR